MSATVQIEHHADHQDAAKVENLPAPVNPNDAARLADVDAVKASLEGKNWKDNVRVSTQGNINLASPGASVDGVAMAADDRVLVRAQTDSSENGVYIWNGAAVAMTRAGDADSADEMESAVVTVDEGTDSGATYRQTQVNFTLDTDDVLWTDFSSSTPAASESTPGKIEIATQTETNTGTDDTRAMTPKKFKDSDLRTKGYSEVIGDNAATQFDVGHNYGTRRIGWAVIRNSSPWDEVKPGAELTSTNNLRLNFVTTPGVDEFEVLVWKLASA
jgi:hypothetical protein